MADPSQPAPPTIADVNPGIPDLRSAPIGSSPIEDPASLHQVFGAANREAQRDSMLADEARIQAGYAPIVQALGLDPTENPAQFGELDAASEARFGNAGGRLSKLATAAGVGEQLPFTNNRMADRVLQETLIAQEIRKHRSTNPNFLPGVPDTVDGIRKMILANEAKASAADQATLARSPGGIAGTAASLGGGAVGTFHDPMNIAALAIPGGGAKGIIQIAARDALINGLIELGQQPIVAHNREELGQHYTLGEGATNVITAGVGGAVFGSALHGAGKLGGAAVDRIMPKIFEAMPESVQRRWADKMKIGDVKLTDVLHDMDNHELTGFARSSMGAHMTPDETAAAHTLERSADVGAASPYAPGPAGDAKHDGNLADAINELVNNRVPQEGGGMTVQSYADRYIRGEGRDDPNMLQFAVNNGPAIEAEFQRRASRSSGGVERPPAGTSTPAARPQPGDLEGTIASFTGKVYHAENATGDVHAKNPKSSASGPAQFTDPTFRDYYRRVYGEDPGAHPARELKDNPEVQSRLLERLTRDNAAHLEAIREPVTEGNLYLMHFAGSGDGAKILKADPDTPIERILSPDVLNRNDFLKGKSASEVIAWAHKKMGGSAAAVPARGAAGELAGAGDDPVAAQLRSEAMALDSQVIGLTRLPDGSPVNLYTRQVPSSAIGVDATRFQFKSGGDEFGVTERLRGVKEWDPGLAGRVTLWEDNAGRQWIADGHQRYGLARRIGAEHGVDIPLDAMVLREADGVSAEDARVWAALKNIAEGTGSPIDAAKVLRDAGEHALDRLPPKSPLVRDGAALARLSDEAFGAVYNERIPADQAAVIGHLLPDHPETHLGMVDLLIKTDPANRAQAQSIVRQAIAAGFHKEEQIDLFGSSSSVASLFAEKAKILERSLARLRKMRLVHNTAANEADTLEEAGSKIAVEQSQKEAQANAEAIAIVDRLAYRAGPVAEALDVAARELAGGGKLSDATKRFVERIRGLDLTALDREAPADNGSGAEVDGVGRGGDGGEEGPSLFAEPSDPGQPSLSELEAATSRFSDPDGPAVKQQAASLEHDLRASVLHADADPAAAVRDQARAIAGELTPGKPQMGQGWTWGERSNLGNDVPKGGMVLDLTTPHGNREFVFDKKGELVGGPLGIAGDRSFEPRPNLAVDGEGKPLTVFRGEHGAGHNGEIQSRLGSISFTADRKVADTYANHPNDRVNDKLALEPRVLEATLDIRKPVMNDPEDPFIDGGTIERALGRDAAIEAALEHSGSIEDTSNWQEEINAGGDYADVADFLAKHPDRVGELYFDAYNLFDDPKWVERFKAAGYDGAIHGGNGESALTAEYKVFDKSQIHPAPTSIDQVLERQRGADLEDLLARAADNQKELETLGPELGQAAGAEFVNPGAKGRARVLAKAADYADPGEIKDLARAGFLVTKRGQGNKILEELRARGFTVYDKGWKPLNGYADRKLIVAFPNGGVAELQIIPKAIADYKLGEGHKLYEIVHDPKTPPAEVEAALLKMKAGYEERLAGTDFEAIGKAAANSALDSGVPSDNADRTVSSEALRQDPATNTEPLLASSTATARSSSSKNLMTGASSIALDMGERADPGKIARDRQLAELGAAAPQRAPSDVAQLGEIGLPLMDATNQFKFRMSDGSADVSAADLIAELDADKKAIDALKGCL